MNKNFNLFRLNCMMDDSKSKNFNAIIVSLISELIYENANKPINRNDCFVYLVKDLKINIQKELFIRIIENSSNFEFSPIKEDVEVKLKVDKYSEINERVNNHSIEVHIEKYAKENSLPKTIEESIENLLYQAIYENINSFTIQNIDSILPTDANKIYSKTEIDAFNDFLSIKDHEKNVALFNVFLKAVEFAIITSGKGVKEFSKNLFQGKEYLLDANIIFRLIGIGGEERKTSLLNLLSACIHQGIKFNYSNETFNEFRRKLEASVQDIKRATENQTIEILEYLVKEDELEFNNGFVIHYVECKTRNEVRSPDQYETKVRADFRTLCKEYDLSTIDVPSNSKSQIDKLQDSLFKHKKEINEYIRYTKTAAKVDATNVFLVKKARGSNDYNYSDIRSFYLTTDRTLNSILAKLAEDKIAETILPSQLFILHNSLSDNGDDKDYDSFTKFLKRRTTGFKFSGRDTLTYIDEIRNYTTEPRNIEEILKAYSDKKFNTSLLDIEVEPEFKSIKEFTETYLDAKLKKAESGDEKYNSALMKAMSDFSGILKSSKNILRYVDIILTIIIIPITILIIKYLTEKIYIIIISVVIAEVLKFLISSKTTIYSNLCKRLFNFKVMRSSYYKTFKENDDVFLKSAKEYIKGDINIWK